MINVYVIPVLLGSVFSFIAGCLILRANIRSTNNISFAIFCFSLFVWLFGYVLAYSTSEESLALFFCRIACTGAMFTAPAFYHFAVSYTKKKNEFTWVFISYFVISIIVPFSLSSELFLSGVYHYFWGYYSKAGVFHPFYLLIFFGIFLRGFYVLYIKKRQVVSPIEKMRINYIFMAYIVALMGAIDYIPKYGIEIFPFGFIFEIIFVIIVGYATIKYQLLNIKIAFTRLSVFIVVYCLVLGIPFGCAIWGRIWLMKFFGTNWFWVPLITITIFATVGPFIYIYLQRRAEARLLEEELRIQELLRRASYGMTNIRSLKKLLHFIVNILMETLGLDNVVIYLKDAEKGGFSLKAAAHQQKRRTRIKEESFLVKKLLNDRCPIVFEEMKLLLDFQGNSALPELVGFVREMEELAAHVVIPIIAEDALIGLIFLGERRDRGIYSTDLINVLSVLGNQAALAVENCNYFAAEAKRIEEQGFQERIAALDMMASSFAHEIDNPNSIIVNQAEYLRERLANDPSVSIPDELRQEFNKTIDYIVESSKRVSGMVESILEYSRLGTGELKPLKINDAIASFLRLIGPRLKNEQVDFIVEIEKKLPFILGDKIQIEEIFMNFMTNALHAVKDIKDKRIHLKVFKKNEDILRVEFSDNGYGIPKKMIKDIFLASVTTKGSSEGTGLGLYHVRKIVDRHRGKVWAESSGEGKGAVFIVEFPIHKGDLREVLDKNIKEKPMDTRKVF